MSDSEDDTVFDDASSQMSESSSNEVDSIAVELFDNIDEYFVLLGDKKMKSMTNALNMIKLCLMKHCQVEVFMKHVDYISTDLIAIIRKERVTTDVSVACQILSLLEVSFCVETTSVFDVCYEILMQRVKATRSKQVAVDCLHAAAVILFLSDSPDEIVDSFLSTILSVIKTPKSGENALLTTALYSWVLINSLKPKYQILTESLPSFVTSVLKCLDINDMNVRIATAKCIAFIHELIQATPSYVVVKPIDTMQECMQEKLNEYNRYWKESRDKNKKLILREITRSCETQSHPQITLTFAMEKKANAELTLKSWSDVIRYEFISKALGHGFRYHLIENALLKDVFANNLTVNRQKMVSSEKAVISGGKRWNIKNKREDRQKVIKAYEDMCLDDMF